MSQTSTHTNKNSILIPLLMVSVVTSATANTIIRRITLVPLKSYPYLLSQMQNIMYTIFYSSILFSRYKQHDGTVTIDMLKIPKRPFIWIGFWDCVGDILGNLGTGHLPGYQVPLLAKLNIIFTAIFSSWILKKMYTTSQISAMSVVLCGSIITLLPVILNEIFSNNDDDDMSNNNKDTTTSLFYAVVYVASVAPTALAFVLKEQIFSQHASLNLDIFVVNTYGSIVSLAFTILLLPLAAVPGFGGISLSELPAYMKNGFQCFRGINPSVDDDCTGAPLAPLLYFGINVTYNICILALVKHGGALLTFLTNTITFPLSTILFTLSWPLLGSSTLSGFVIAGLIVELTGVIFYQRASSSAVSKSNEVKDEDEEQLELLNETSPNGNGNYGSI